MYTYMHPRDKAQLGAYHMKLLSWLCLSRHKVTGVILLWEYTPLQLQAVTYVPFPWVLQSINDLAKFPAVGWLLLVAGTWVVWCPASEKRCTSGKTNSPFSLSRNCWNKNSSFPVTTSYVSLMSWNGNSPFLVTVSFLLIRGGEVVRGSTLLFLHKHCWSMLSKEWDINYHTHKAADSAVYECGHADSAYHKNVAIHTVQ